MPFLSLFVITVDFRVGVVELILQRVVVAFSQSNISKKNLSRLKNLAA